MLNWLIRYAPAIAALETHGPLGSIIDVGCGTHGLACVRPDRPFVGLEVAYDGEPAPSMVPFISDGGALPWRDGAFDTVLCLDVLEHVPPAERSTLVAELSRVAARQVLLACPSSRAQAVDDLLCERLTADGGAPPPWLAEHYECGLPEPAEVEELVRAVEGFVAEPVPMVNAALGTMIVMADMDPDFAASSRLEYLRRSDDWVRLLGSACFGESLRVAWRMERVTPRPALVGTGDLEREAVAAMRIPGARLLADASMSASQLDTDAPLRLWLSPHWPESATWLEPLSAYLAFASADGSTCLCLESTGHPEAAQQVEAVCLSQCGEAPFADVLLIEGVSRPRDAVPVSTPEDVRAALAVPAA